MPSSHTLNQAPETRQRLLDAGVRLFAEHGFKGVSVRDISAEAGTNIAAINYHFGSKQGLYRSIFEATLDADEARFRDALETIQVLAGLGRDDPAQLVAAVRLYVRNLLGPLTAEERTRWFAVLAIREMAFPTDAFEQIYRRRAEPSQTALAGIIAAVRSDTASPEAQRLEAHTLTGMILGFGIARAILWRRMEWSCYTPERVAQIGDIITDLICRALGIPSAPGTRAPDADGVR